MIKVKVVELEEYIKAIEKQLDNYTESKQALFYEYQNASSYWNDTKKNQLYEKIDEDKVNFQKWQQMLQFQLNIYKTMVNDYKVMGKTILCNLDAKDSIMIKLNNCINELNKIISSYEQLNVSFYPRKGKLYMEKQKLQNNVLKMKKVNTDIKNKFDKVAKIENKVTTTRGKFPLLKVE